MEKKSKALFILSIIFMSLSCAGLVFAISLLGNFKNVIGGDSSSAQEALALTFAALFLVALYFIFLMAAAILSLLSIIFSIILINKKDVKKGISISFIVISSLLLSADIITFIIVLVS